MNNMLESMTLQRRQLMVGRAKRMFDEGHSVMDICEELKLNESTVRAIKCIIDEDEKNKNR